MVEVSMELRALADRVEAITPDEAERIELGVQVNEALGIASYITDDGDPTQSVDAAITLVPKGWTFANLSQSDNKGWWCELRRGFLTSYDKVALGRQLENAAPALAVTAAALRARASLLDSPHTKGDEA